MSTTPELEAVAAALWNAESVRALGKDRLEPWAEVNGHERTKWVGLARAALRAIRVPTPAMLDAVHEADVDASGDFEDVFTAAIYHILGETGE